MKRIYAENPPIYRETVEVYPEWVEDGGDPRPRKVALYYYPADSLIDALLKEERAKLPKDLFGEPPIYTGPDLAELESK